FHLLNRLPRQSLPVNKAKCCLCQLSSAMWPNLAGLRISAGSEIAADLQKFLPPGVPDFVSGKTAEIRQRVRDDLAGGGDDCLRVAMGAPDRFGNDVVDNPETFQVFGGDLHVGRGLPGAGGIAPQDGGRS